MQELKVLNWNVRKAKKDSLAWDVVAQIDADIVTLQEVSGIADFIRDRYSVLERKTVRKNGAIQPYTTAILAKGEILDNLVLESELDWVNHELSHYSGNLLAAHVHVENLQPIKVVSVYSPAWPVSAERLLNIDFTSIKLTKNPDHAIWCTEILWSALKNVPNLRNDQWIVTGDFNSSPTFDLKRVRGNQELIDRLNSIGLTECLYSFNDALIPTFKNVCGGKIVHQMDHMYVSESLYKGLRLSHAPKDLHIFEKSISDHLPIISNFRLKVKSDTPKASAGISI